jgi:hypothetical protein
MDELKRNYEKVAAELEQAKMTPARNADQADVVIRKLKRPKGEAGDRRKGFILQEAMGLEGEEGSIMYKRIQVGPPR